jgi:hypothetical protein
VKYNLASPRKLRIREKWKTKTKNCFGSFLKGALSGRGGRLNGSVWEEVGVDASCKMIYKNTYAESLNKSSSQPLQTKLLLCFGTQEYEINSPKKLSHSVAYFTASHSRHKFEFHEYILYTFSLSLTTSGAYDFFLRVKFLCFHSF